MTPDPAFVLTDADDVRREPVENAPALDRAVLIDESDGAPQFALRRFTLAPDGEVPRHTNEVEHVQYALNGGYVVGAEDEEHRVEAGAAMLIPAGTVHWYRNPADEPASFLCAVPHGDDTIELVDD